MKRLLVMGVGALMLSACGGGGSAVGANSAESTEITAVGTIVGNAGSNASADNASMANSAAAAVTADNIATSPDAASANAADGAAASNDSGQ